MARDPYGFHQDEPAPSGERGWSAWLLPGTVTLLFLTCSLCCAGGATFVTSFAEDQPRLIDKAGVWMILSLPLWPALGVALSTLVMYAGLRKWWVAVGPNLILGVVGGLGFWFLAFLAVVIVAVATE
ncbi:MAG TPA: hypothetical protein PKY30_10270 [Myxococcota bacterium]|nr:hypothetical protein [Myxococcota bacterium]